MESFQLSTPAAAERRVLLFVATRKDAAVSQRLLASADLPSHVCETSAALSAEIRSGAAAILATEDLLETAHAAAVVAALDEQEEWSDLPIVLLLPGGARSESAAGALERLPNVILLERPTTMRSVLSAVQAAVRARSRQYETRAYIQAIKAAEAKAREADRAKNDFLAALSHELRTPLTPVLLVASEAVNDATSPPHAREVFELIVKNIGLEARLIDDLLDLTRITHGKLHLVPRPADVLPILRDAIATVRPEMLEKKLRVESHFEAPQAVVRCDATRLQQVFWNVLRNAVKFTPPGGAIDLDVSLSADRGTVLIAVTDTGIGMGPEELAHAFDAFVQGDHAKRDGPHRFGGLGLGLAISRSLVEMHAGKITAHSEGGGKGSTFTIELPLAVESSHAPDETVLTDVPAPRRLRVLLVEDHESSREALRRTLTTRGHAVTAAASVAEARALAQTITFDLLMTDIGLPDGTGHDLLRQLRPAGEWLAVALTGYGMEDDVSRSKDAGFFAHLTKPLRAAELDAMLQSVSAALAAGVPVAH